jgi:plasmid stabilization system protein ParE
VYKIFWLQSAVNDLDRLKYALADASQVVANKAVSAIKKSTNKLKDFPLIGTPVDDLEGFYDLFIEFGAYGYHLRYRFFKEKVYIVHVKHMRELEFLI